MGGTEAFPDHGMHCQHPECNQLDFLPFNCDSCHKVFCLEHRSHRSHECPNSDHKSRKVVVCEICSTAIETTGRGGEEEKSALERHEKSGDCDPQKKRKPTCPVRRCREVLTFSNTSTCKSCQLQVCLKHRFPADHGCGHSSAAAPARAAGSNKFLIALAARNAKAQDCAKDRRGGVTTSPPSTPSVKAC